MSKKGYLTRLALKLALGAAALAPALSGLQCGGEVPFTAPGGATLTISANPTAIPIVNGESIITVIGFKRAEDGGGPLTDGTQIFFTTSVGLIEERVETLNGIARGHLRSSGRAGRATIRASSGQGVTAELANGVLIGNAEGINIILTANPPTVGPPDFTSELIATVVDNDNNPMRDVPIIFTTSGGALASQGSILRTNVLGQVLDRLTLRNEASASVTARSGAVSSNSVTVSRGAVVTPVIVSVSPASGRPGTTLTVTISGRNFQPGALVGFGEGIVVNSRSFVNAETLRASITIDAAAATGTRTVTVTNPDGGSGTLAGGFRVSANAPPTCDFVLSPIAGGAGTAASPFLTPVGVAIISFNASASNDPDGTIISYAWDFGDGTPAGSGVTTSHDYTATTAVGDIVAIVLVVTDNAGGRCTRTLYLEFQ